MKRAAFAMRINQGCAEEYKKRHDEIWPELRDELSRAGISDYSIYLDEGTCTLFAFQKLTDDNTADGLASNPVVRKWWDYMADIMEYTVDNEPMVIPLKEVFHMD